MSFCETGGAPACNNAQRVAGTSIRENLVSFSELLSRTFGCELRVPEDMQGDPREVKEFCGALLDPSGHHPWAPVLRRLPAADRLSIAGSLFSFRKTLPTADPDVDAYVRQMSGVGVSVSDRYIRFVRRKIRKLFRVGWDRRWRDVYLSTTPGTSSACSWSRKEGGARGALSGGRDWFLRSCLGIERDLNVSTVREVGIARCAGKSRRVTKSPAETIVLSPLHSLLYSHMSKQDWLLRGEATPVSFAGFERKEGEVFVSGDYESASDNLSIEVAEAILDEIFKGCRYVPSTVKKVAMDSLRCVLVGPNSTGLQARGQLMGNFLCFPLLCLQNYLAFCFLTGGRHPVRINGDDIVFRAPVPVYERWAKGVQDLGLVLSRGKTFVHRRFFSLNSTYFRARSANGVKGVPIVRATLFYNGVESADSISGRFSSVAKYFDEPRGRALRIALLVKLSSVIRCTQRSVRRGLGMNATAHELSRAGLFQREVFYSGLPVERRPPAKIVVRGAIPAGWVKRRPRWSSAKLKDDPEFSAELVRHCWNSRIRHITTDDYWKACRDGTVSYKPVRADAYRKKAKLLQISVGAARKFLQGGIGTYSPPAKSVWRRMEVQVGFA